MNNEKFKKSDIVIVGLAAALGFALFGPVSLVIIGVYLVWKSI